MPTSEFLKLNKKKLNLSSFIAEALREDVGDGDHTSLATIPASQSCKMQLLAKEPGIIAGVEVAAMLFRKLDPSSKVLIKKKDGAIVKTGDVVLRVNGRTRKLLTAERTVLNIMQRMSGIATHTSKLQQLCAGTNAQVIDTRKTTPGFRFFEKWAVVIGGGANHRYGLYDMILVKDNHIDAAGGIGQALDAVKAYLKKTKKKLAVEVETRTVAEVQQVLQYGGVQRIMLDNFSLPEVNEAVRLIAGKCEVEASGGINGQTIAAYAACGVDFISVGALTHHVRSLDLSLKII